MAYRHALSGEDTGGKVLTFSLRVRDEKKKSSEFAEPVACEPVTPPAPPGRVRAVVFEDRIQLTWNGPEPGQKEGTPAKAAAFNLYRSDGTGPARRLNSTPLKKAEFLDKDFAFGQAYRYFARSVLEGAPPVESDDSETVEVMAKDVFPPAPPSGLTAISGEDFIALSWEAGREPDLAGYKVWRRAAGEGDFVLVAQLAETVSSFSDSKVEKGGRYEYAISALDATGNESRRSAAVAGIVRDDTP
jgi:fibronectin type 3 domain-containing protein